MCDCLSCRPTRDAAYDFDMEAEDEKAEKEAARAELGRQQYVSRVIAHPSFFNVDFHRAEKMLAHKGAGELVIRPSSRVRWLCLQRRTAVLLSTVLVAVGRASTT